MIEICIHPSSVAYRIESTGRTIRGERVEIAMTYGSGVVGCPGGMEWVEEGFWTSRRRIPSGLRWWRIARTGARRRAGAFLNDDSH